MENSNESNDSAEINDMTASQSPEEAVATVINEIRSLHTHDPTDVREYVQDDSSVPSTSRDFSFYGENANEARESYDLVGRKTYRNEEDCMSEISVQSFNTDVSEMVIDVEIEDSCIQNDLMNKGLTPSVNESTRVPFYSNSFEQQLSREPQRYEERSPTNHVPSDIRLLSQEDLERIWDTSNNFDLLEIHDSEKKLPTNEYRQISEDVNAGEILRNTQKENLETLSCIPKNENNTCILSDEVAKSTYEKNEIMTRNISTNLSQTKEKSSDDLCFHIGDVSKAIRKALENINTTKARASANHEAMDKSNDFHFGSNMAKVINNRVNSTEEVKYKDSFRDPFLNDTCLKEDIEPKTAYLSRDAVSNAMQTDLNKLRKQSEFSLKVSPLHGVAVEKVVPKGDRNHYINECSKNLQTFDSNVSHASVAPVDIKPQQSTEKRKISSPQEQTDDEMDIDVEIEDSYFQKDLMKEHHTPSVNESTRVTCYSNSFSQEFSREPQRHEGISPTNYVPDSRLVSQEDLGKTSTNNNFDLLEIHDSENMYPTNEYRQISEDLNAVEILRNTQEENLETLSCISKIENTTCNLSDEMASSTHEKKEIMTRNISSLHDVGVGKEVSKRDRSHDINECSQNLQTLDSNVSQASVIPVDIEPQQSTQKRKTFSSQEQTDEVAFLKRQKVPEAKKVSKSRSCNGLPSTILTRSQTAFKTLNSTSTKSNELEIKKDPDTKTNKLKRQKSPNAKTNKREIQKALDSKTNGQKRQKVPETKKATKSRLERTIFTRSETALKTLNSNTVKSNVSKRQKTLDGKIVAKGQRKVRTKTDNNVSSQGTLNSISTKSNDFASIRDNLRRAFSPQPTTSFVLNNQMGDMATTGDTSSNSASMSFVEPPLSAEDQSVQTLHGSASFGVATDTHSNDMTKVKSLNSTTAKPNKRKIHETPDGKTVAKSRSCIGVHTNTDNDVLSQGSINSNISKSSNFATIKDNFRRTFSPQPTTSFVPNNEMGDMAITGDTSSNSTSMSFSELSLSEDQSANFGFATGNHTNEEDPSQQIPTCGNKTSGHHVSETEVKVSKEGDQ